MTLNITPEQDRQAQRLAIALITGLMLEHNGHGEDMANVARGNIVAADCETGGLMTVLVFHVLGSLLAKSLTDFATLAEVDPLEYWQGIAQSAESQMPL